MYFRTILNHLIPFKQARIGQTLVHLDGERTSCRLGECVLGNLVTDAAVYSVALASKTVNAWTTASIALWTSNSIMASIDANSTGNVIFRFKKGGHIAISASL